MANRLDIQAAISLWQKDVFTLGRLAHEARCLKHPKKIVTYIIDRNINYTNICVSECRFCAFHRAVNQDGGYVLSLQELSKKVEETISLGGIQILLQGGMNPNLELNFYTTMLQFLKKQFPQIAIHGFSPTEIHFFSEKFKKTVAEIITILRESGLDSIPGGGAEILVDRVRESISPNKCNTKNWLSVMELAHAQGMRTTATMMFGQAETFEERILHLERIRNLQDKTGGFTAFIPWTFQPQNTKMQNYKELSSTEYLKFLALSRLYLDNIDNIQASWVTQGGNIGQLGLLWGANDFGSTMIEENVVAAAGVSFQLPENKLRALIEEIGFEPRKRNMRYELLD